MSMSFATIFLSGMPKGYSLKVSSLLTFKGICDIHQRVKGDGCRHVRSFNIADMRAADAHHLSKLKLIQPLKFSVIGDVTRSSLMRYSIDLI